MAFGNLGQGLTQWGQGGGSFGRMRNQYGAGWWNPFRNASFQGQALFPMQNNYGFNPSILPSMTPYTPPAMPTASGSSALDPQLAQRINPFTGEVTPSIATVRAQRADRVNPFTGEPMPSISVARGVTAPVLDVNAQRRAAINDFAGPLVNGARRWDPRALPNYR